MTAFTRACDALATALEHPKAGIRDRVLDAVAAVEAATSDGAAHARRFATGLLSLPLAEIQELYARTFDFDPRCTMDTGWHVFGDAYDRGAFLAALREALCAAGVPESPELPDHLPQVLRLVGRLPAQRAAEFGAIATLAVDRMIDALAGRQNPYEHVLRAVGVTLRSMAPVESPTGAGV
jgi:nitrate reductase delta subunit